MKRPASIAAGALMAALTLSASAEAGNLRRFIGACDGRLCPWFVADIAAPKGWREDIAYGQQQKMLVLLPEKAKLGPEDPLIYLRTTFNNDGRTLDQQAETSNRRWQQAAGQTAITRLPDIPRAAGKGVWQVFRYENPGKPRQAHELLAFGEHAEGEGQKFFHMVVITGATAETLDKARPAWLTMLNSL